MSANKFERVVRRRNAQLAVERQLFICWFHHATINGPVGVFRKRKALNCGRSRCHLCVNPRRLWGRLTIPEIRANEAFKYDLRNYAA